MKATFSYLRAGLFVLVELAGLFLLSTFAIAGSATWNLNPTSGDWNTAVNWTPATIPNGPSDVATFALSNTTAISLSADVQLDSLIYSAGASAFTISVHGDLSLSLSGAGLQNNSSATQNIDLDANGTMNFQNSSLAGTATYTVHAPTETTLGGYLYFRDSSSADHSSLNTEGQNVIDSYGSTIYFSDNSTAGEASLLNGGSNAQQSFGSGGQALFSNSSSAGNAYIDNNAGNVTDGSGGYVSFSDTTSAGTATIINRGATHESDGGSLGFFGSATADHCSITNEGSYKAYGSGGAATFSGQATAADATVLVEGSQVSGGFAGNVFFYGGDAGNATFTLTGGVNGSPGAYVSFLVHAKGGSARFILSGNSVLDISGISNSSTFTLGSLEGSGNVYLGKETLIVGSNNLDTAFSTSLFDGNNSGGVGPAFLQKVGTGTLTLTGPNYYTGGTTVVSGQLVVNNLSETGTGFGPVSVNAGTLGGQGLIFGAVTVGTGAGSGAILAPGTGSNKRTALTIQSALTLNSDATYTYVFKAKGGTYHAASVTANGLTIDGATLNLKGRVQGTLQAGLVLTLISNTSANPISGTFNNLPDGAIVRVDGNNLQASYSGGDGNDLTLTVVP